MLVIVQTYMKQKNLKREITYLQHDVVRALKAHNLYKNSRDFYFIFYKKVMNYLGSRMERSIQIHHICPLL